MKDKKTIFDNQNKDNNLGFTLVEALVFLFVFSIITVTFYQSWAVATRAIVDSRKKAGAVALANETMEQIRNMSYDRVGIISGDVIGDIPSAQTITRSGIEYSVNADVDAVNDSFDGVEDDANPIDYKKVVVNVSWSSGDDSRSATLVSTFTPPGIEDVFTGGILKLKIVNNDGNPIQSVWVRIKNDLIVPSLDTYEQTDANGEIWLYQSSPSLETYEITVSPSGRDSFDYYQVATFARTATFEPSDVHGSVVGGVINSKTIKTDKISDVDLHLRTPLDNIVQNETFNFKGGRDSGYDLTLPGERYYLESVNLNSGLDGDVSFGDTSSGSYFFIYPADDPDYKFLWIDESVTLSNKFDLSPNVKMDAYARLAPKNMGSLLIKVVDKTDETPIVGAYVEAVSGAVTISGSTNQYGYVYFPDLASGLSALPDGGYAITAEKDGDNDSKTESVSGSLAEVIMEL